MPRLNVAQLAVTGSAAALLVLSIVGLVQRDTDVGAGGSQGRSPVAATSVAIVDFTFDAPAIRVAVGNTVTWTNEDQAVHTVTAVDGGPLDSGDVAEGATYAATFDMPGTFAYMCAFHPNMMGTVEVTG